MKCPECNGHGETIYYVETDRDEYTVTIEQRKGICRTCNGSGDKPMTNADRIRAMSDEELREFLCSNTQCRVCKFEGWCGCDLLKWLQQPAEVE